MSHLTRPLSCLALILAICLSSQAQDILSVNFYAYGNLPQADRHKVTLEARESAGVGTFNTTGWENYQVPWAPSSPQTLENLTYSWTPVLAGMHKAEWEIFAYDLNPNPYEQPLPKKGEKAETVPCEFKSPAGQENWFAANFNAAKAGWTKAPAPFGKTVEKEWPEHVAWIVKNPLYPAKRPQGDCEAKPRGGQRSEATLRTLVPSRRQSQQDCRIVNHTESFIPPRPVAGSEADAAAFSLDGMDPIPSQGKRWRPDPSAY